MLRSELVAMLILHLAALPREHFKYLSARRRGWHQLLGWGRRGRSRRSSAQGRGGAAGLPHCYQ